MKKILIFKKDVFDQDTHEIVWEKNKGYFVLRENDSQMILENETGKSESYGIPTNRLRLFQKVSPTVDSLVSECEYYVEKENGEVTYIE